MRNAIAWALVGAGVVRAFKIFGVDPPMWLCLAIGLAIGLVAAALENRDRDAARRAVRALDQGQRSFHKLTHHRELVDDYRDRDDPFRDPPHFELGPPGPWHTCAFCGSSFNTSATSRCPHCLQPANRSLV